MTNEINEEIMKAVTGKPKWLNEKEDDTYEIKHKDVTYILEEQSGEIMEQCSRLSEKSNTPMESLLARRSIKSPVLTDDTYAKLPGSIYTKIKLATIYIHGLNDF